MEQGEYDPESVSAGRKHPTGVSQTRKTLVWQRNVHRLSLTMEDRGRIGWNYRAARERPRPAMGSTRNK